MLASWFGGSNMWVVNQYDENHIVAKVIGPKPFERLVSAFGGTVIFIPRATFTARVTLHRRVFDMLRRGTGLTDIATETGLCEAHLANMRRAFEDKGMLPVILREPLQDAG
jgi:hypothetical protein